MPKISLISDVHLEFSDLTLPGGDILILSGDTFEAKNLKKEMYDPNMTMLAHERKDWRPDRYYRFIEEECSKKYREVIMVLGNHEHYHFQYQKTYNHVKAQLPSNVHLLQDEIKDIDGILFLGATLWTDMNKMDPLTLHAMSGLMSDFRVITMFNEAKSVYHKLDPRRVAEDHLKTKQYFKIILETNRASTNPKPVVVVTHHAPSALSINDRYKHDSLMNGGYYSDLSDMILDNPEIKVWTHGHMHNRSKYQIGDSWVLCNPRGYVGHEPAAADCLPRNFEIASDGMVTIDGSEWE